VLSSREDKAKLRIVDFSEPGFKATFQLEITHDRSYHALSTMSVSSRLEMWVLEWFIR
jgi:hypothetical protein